MTLKRKINDLSDRIDDFETEASIVSGALTRNEAENYAAAGFETGNVLLLPEPLTLDEWLQRAQALSEQQRASEAGRRKEHIQSIDAPAVQRPYQEPPVRKDNTFLWKGLKNATVQA
jgi:hypothetical protein